MFETCKSFYLESGPITEASSLKPGWIKKTLSHTGDAILSFTGTGNLTDFSPGSEDAYPDHSCLHFVAEHYAVTKRELLFYHMLFLNQCGRLLGLPLTIQEGELFLEDTPLTRSFFSFSKTSGLFYSRFLVSKQDLPTLISLDELNIEPKSFSIDVMNHYTKRFPELNQLEGLFTHEL